MDFFPIVLFVMILFGIGLIIFSSTKMSYESGSNSSLQIDNTIKVLNTAIEEADTTIVELDNFSKSVLSEMENKYQEILYLYSLLEENKKDLSNFSIKEPPVSEDNTKDYKEVKQEVKEEVKEEVKLKPKKINAKLQEIRKLYLEGLSVSAIAKSLDMGIGEVKLIIELGRDM